jgi:type III pantothenate kinase
MTILEHLIGIDVGNSRTHIGIFNGEDLGRREAFDHDDLTPAIQFVCDAWKSLDVGEGENAVVLASVNDHVASKLSSAVADQLSVNVYRVGEDMPVPIGRQLDPETITGVDRLLNAAAAFDASKEACIVVDAGTAVTVDFVDGEGTFHGGAIAPGARMQLKALHDSTEALPELEFAAPDADAFGRSTTQAILHGVFHGIRGMVWKLVEQYAEAYEAFPMVVATGGDAELLFEKDELINRIVPDLTLRGIYVTARTALAGAEEEKKA